MAVERRKTQSVAIRMKQRAEFFLLRMGVGGLGLLPRSASRWVGSMLGRLSFALLPRLRGVGLRNLEIAFPTWTRGRALRLLRQEFEHLGRMLAECSLMARYRSTSDASFIRYDGLDRYLRARDKGRGVLVLTGHLGAWELSSFFHSLMGYPMAMVIRRLDNPHVDAFVNRIRCLHGNRVLHKDDFARGILQEMRAGGTVGILMDTNMTPPQGVFVPFFGVPACSASGLARVARKTGAAVLPGFLLGEGDGRYRLHFGKELPVVVTEDAEADAVENTARFTAELERYIRETPEQWLWMHRRWKTRPQGSPRIYA